MVVHSVSIGWIRRVGQTITVRSVVMAKDSIEVEDLLFGTSGTDYLGSGRHHYHWPSGQREIIPRAVACYSNPSETRCDIEDAVISPVFCQAPPYTTSREQ